MSSTGQIIGGVVGTVVGAFVGYPMLGAQIGLMVGGYLDPPKQKINRPTTDLSVQTATYGAPVGTGYGNYATFGNVFWVEGNQLRLVEGDDGGKGGGSEPTPDKVYATFAVGFGEGEISAFGRVWCNGKLVYDPTSSDIGAQLVSAAISAANATLSATKNRSSTGGDDGKGHMDFYLGTATQLPDPRIQADMGAAYAPGYRGLRYIVFKDWPMADYGNTLMGMQVKVEIVNSSTVDQYRRLMYVDALLPDTTDFPGAHATEYGYFNPRIDNGLFVCEQSSEADGYMYCAAISHEGNIVSSNYGGSFDTGKYGYIGQCAAGQVVYDVSSYTANFTVGGSVFKVKTSDENNTCHGMSVGADGRIYALERVAGAWLFNIYNGETLALISSGTNYSIRFGDTNISYPCIPGGATTFCVESDGRHVWTAQQGGMSVNFMVCEIDDSGHLNTVHSFNIGTEGYLGPSGQFSCLYADGGMCFGVNNHGGFFEYSRNEIIAQTSVPLADIIEARCLLSGMLTSSDLDLTEITQMVRGYRVQEVSAIRASLEPLQGAFPFDIIPSGYQLAFKPRGASSVATIDIGELGCVAGNDKPGDILTQSREMDSQLPIKVQVTYFDVNREYDRGTGPGAMRLNTDAVNIQNIDMPIVLDANEAAGIEEVLLYMYWMERTEFRFVLPPTRRNLEPSDVITLTAPGASYELRLTEISDLQDGRMECSARPNNAAVYTPTAQGQEGLSQGQILAFPGATLFHLLDLPCVDSTYMDKPGFVVAMDGYSSAWTGGTLYGTYDQGSTWQGIDSLTAPGSMLGEMVAAPGAGRTDTIDPTNTITARFYSTANLATLTWAEIYAEGNHFAIGAHGRWEIVGAKTVIENADGTWTLSDLMRGRYGTERNTGGHIHGDIIALLDPSRLEFIGMSVSTIGVERQYSAATLGQALNTSLAVPFTYSAENLECLPPIHIKGAKNASGDWGIAWTRRTRTPVEPFSGINAPLAETGEAYEVEVWDSTWATLKRTITGLTSPAATYTSAQQTTDFGAVQKLLYVKVYQLSPTVGRGYGAHAVLGNLAILNVKSLIHFDDSPASIGRVLGLHMDGTNSSTTFTDVTGKAVTAVGNAQISTAQYPALTGKTSSGYFDGTGDYLTASDSTDWDFGTGDFAIIFLVRFSAHTSNMALVSQYQNSTTGWIVQYVNSDTTLRFYYAGDTNASVTWSPSDNTWYHIAVTRSGSSLRFFVNGTQVGSTITNSTNISGSTAQLQIGTVLSGSNPFNGYMSEVEIYKGYAIYTSNFTPPSIPFSTSGQSILDKAENSISVIGTAVTVSQTDAFGGTCLQANQSSGYVLTPVIPLTELYWTIDLWIKPDALPSSNYMGVFDYGTAADGLGGLCVVLRNDGLPMCFLAYAVEVNANVTCSVGERIHIFIQRSGSKIYMGAKGTVGTNLNVPGYFVGDKGFRIGYANVTYLETKAIKIDEFRVFSGEAKYPLSGTYVIPTTPFPDL